MYHHWHILDDWREKLKSEQFPIQCLGNLSGWLSRFFGIKNSPMIGSLFVCGIWEKEGKINRVGINVYVSYDIMNVLFISVLLSMLFCDFKAHAFFS